jgi:hypothetical protein
MPQQLLTATGEIWNMKIWVRVIVFKATFNNISVISWRSVLLVEETGVPLKSHWPAASHWQTLWRFCMVEHFVWLNNLVFCSSYSVHTLFRKTHLGDTLVLIKKNSFENIFNKNVFSFAFIVLLVTYRSYHPKMC